ncbi:MAG: D-lyxose/D-mannose family sugar isomerase [Chitinophagaceae bacterium]|nr:D-lyxose/D-mannose family sugar isomerase [Chitinophagaceae bacterium]
MKRSEVNAAYQRARQFFEANGWAILPHFKWDITDFGLGHFSQHGLVLINLAEEKEYCEKLMYAEASQTTPAHYHQQKKEDIICRTGQLIIQLWPAGTQPQAGGDLEVKVNGQWRNLAGGSRLLLQAVFRQPRYRPLSGH